MKHWYWSSRPFLTIILLLSTSSAAFPSNHIEEIPRSDCLLAADPRVEVEPDGTVLISVETLRSLSGGQAYLGLIPQAAEIGYPVYVLKCDGALQNSRAVSFEFNLKGLEVENRDINDLAKDCGGRLAYRLSLFAGKPHVFDRFFAYGRSPAGQYFRAPALVEGPFVDCVAADSAVISWEFDLPTACRLEVQPSDLTLDFDASQLRSEVTLPRLSPLTTYFYQITWSNGGVAFSSSRLQFRTAPLNGSDEPFRFAVLSDCRGTIGDGDRSVEGVNQAVLERSLEQAYSQNVSLIVIPGDLVSGYTSDADYLESQLRAWKRVVSPIAGGIPIYEGIGNHDLVLRFFEKIGHRNYVSAVGTEAGEVLFARHFVNPPNGPESISADFPPYRGNVYSFDWGNAHFTVLNCNYRQKGPGKLVSDMEGELEGTLRDEQLEWLDRDLQSARTRGQRHFFVFLHEPAFPNGGHTKDAMWWSGEKPDVIERRNRFWMILCQYRVLALFAGHEHNYSRTLIDETVDPSFSAPIWQIVTGGGGAPFYARDKSVPWSNQVQKFYPLEHLCVLDVNGEKVILTVLTPQGLAVEQVELTK